MLMNKYLAALGVAVLAACAESSDPTGFDVQHTIEVPGNVLGTAGCTEIDLAGCYAILDNQLKVLYERTSWAARRGEAEYKVITATNKNLSAIFMAETATVPETLRALDEFIGDLQRGIDDGRVGTCWGDHLVAFGTWIRGKVAAGDVDVSDAPVMDCFVSPVASVVVRASETDGVVLTLNDPWQYTGDPYGVYETRTYFVVTGPNGTITTPSVLQAGAAQVVVADTATRAAGAHTYSVVQCADWGQCSESFAFDVTIEKGSTGGSDPGCVHDNRDKRHRGPPTVPICKKGKKN
jgi:hypothetical protein